ncbi:hypothetical protein OEZ85_001803 [Tetradesmus obliquus]|uniref:glutathione-specific gamma-glutamylcyclotransferase n=1 Tax=Tetradesmus obliquus TaxID=3088 RepID=A0ABY8U0Z7_TETOB|nr:hypothetical protein OEZ85_001803 [Tetradesmus obliquus]
MKKSIAIFGYGSLVWRPGFEYKSKVVGFIRGYKRVFWQGSTDHRGTPEAPGRTVTLAEEEGAVTWGVAYRLAGSEEQQQQTIAYLEWREKQYDVRRLCHMYTADSPDQPVLQDVMVYIATQSPANVNWLGPAPLPAIAQQIATSRGPSGSNHEYLLQLAEAMRQINIDDPELFELEGMR